ncbi:MAG: zinc-ribbon domain-containing protein [Desulfobaccales bacterium]
MPPSTTTTSQPATCPQCQKEYTGDATFCPHCGQRITKA